MNDSTRNELYDECSLCPRECKVNRNAQERGICGETSEVRVACACIHSGEEPPITGSKGSGTVFFSGCTLHCPFCQNYQISREGMGRAITVTELSDMFLALQNKGASNINLVTGNHFTPGILSALENAKAHGLAIPIVWNTGGYEKTETLALLAPFIDVWLPDMKTIDADLAESMFDAPDYPEKNKQALLFMADRADAAWDGDLLTKGLIVRHLIIPGHTEASKAVLRWFRKELRGKALLSLMSQYLPMFPEKYSIDSNVVSREEYDDFMFFLDELGINEGFIQEYSADSDWRPDFVRVNPFPEAFAQPVWHFATGYNV